MRLHCLEMTAVGPFADRQAIDFDRLGSGGLFLFEGPTGVGKSTILDALTFALYGGLASAAGDVARMRSDFADPSVRPEVVLEFSVRGRRFRVRRSPEFARPKLRGRGTTVEKATVHLQRWDADGWETLSTSKEEVGGILTDLVGVNREQFRQVVLLPQGEFATFLRADDDTRRDVLTKLFGTHFYRHVTEALQSRAQAARAAVQVADAALGARVAAAWEAAALVRDDGSIDASLTDQVDLLVGLAGELRAAAGSAEEAATAAEAVEGRLSAELAAAEDVVARLERRAALLVRVEAAEAQRPVHEERRRTAADARRAAPVHPLLGIVAEAEQRVRECRTRAAAVGGDVDALDRGAEAQSLAARARTLRTAAEGLGHLVADEASLGDRRASLAGLRTALADAVAEQQSLQEQRDALPDLIEAARAELDAAQEARAGSAAVRITLDALRGQLAAAEQVVVLTEQLVSLREGRRAARRRLEAAQGDLDLLHEHRLANLRGELAARLVSGDPCLVCGSTEHPLPASAASAVVTDQQARDAVARRDEAAIHRDEIEIQVARAEAALESAQGVSGGAGPQELVARIDEASATLARAAGVQDSLPALSARVEALSATRDSIITDLLLVGQRVAGLSGELSRAERELQEDEQRLEDARLGFPSVAARIEDLSALAETVEARSSALAELARAEQAAVESSGRAEREARAQGFASAAEARAAAMDPADLRALEDQIEQWQSGLDAALAQLGAPDLAAVAELDPAASAGRVVELRDRFDVASRGATEARRAATLAIERATRFGTRLDEVRDAAGLRAAAAAEADEIIALDQYARGMAGSPRMSLVTYVLRYWFEQVVDAANVRLQAMSAGKYELLRVDVAARRDARVGLGLAVLDRHTGRERSPGTLSGGETFYTSLALALGLADVVVAQAGGAQLDTLFIDEGFGSLDPDTLDDVMGVIDELRGNGRVVGIVSHVPDLKERIAERLSVRRARPDGPSRVEVIA
jgi:exonuclease SbcC